MSTGIHQTCMAKIAADTMVMIASTTANSFPIVDAPLWLSNPSHAPATVCRSASARPGVATSGTCAVTLLVKIRRDFKGKTDCLRLAGADRDVLTLCPILFVPCGHGVLTRWETLQAERPIRV